MEITIMSLPAGLSIRAPRHEDAEAVAELLRACDVVIFGEPDTDVKDVRDDWAAPDFDLARDAWALCGEEGSILGFASLRSRERGKDFDGDIRIHPAEQVSALAPALLDAVERRAQELHSPQGAWLCFFAASVETEMRSVLERAGYEEARTFFRMRIDLDPSEEGSRGEPSLPSAIEIRPMRFGTDDRAIHATIEESFAEHFRHTARAFDEWWALRARHEKFDPGLWLLAWDGTRAAGALTGYDFGDIGFVRELGVLKPWRGKGIAGALLTRSLQAFRARGQRRVALGVDAENESAIGLYQRVGMRVDSRHQLLRRRIGP